MIQHFAEKAVSDAMEQYRANKVYCIVMDPNTGDILAMANRPDFDPNDPPRELGYEGMEAFVKNIAAKDNMDPGSTFKIITTAAALETVRESGAGEPGATAIRICLKQYRIHATLHLWIWPLAWEQNSFMDTWMHLVLAAGPELTYMERKKGSS